MDNKNALLFVCGVLLGAPALAHMEDDPVLWMFKIDEFERHDADGDPWSWDAEAWVGKDLNKFRLKTEGKRTDDKTESTEAQALYSRAVAPYWDLQAGVRSDLRPDGGHDWAVIGFQGVAPYWFEIDTALFIGENGRTALRIKAEYEILFTQKLVLSPEIEFDFYGKDDSERDIGSGLSNTEAGLRLRYEIRPEFAPYIGASWERVYGGTEDFVRAAGGETRDNELVVGIKAWF